MNLPKRKPVIGILGGVGAGKSTVARELAALGCEIIDGDAIGHELLERPDVRTQLREQWGDGIFGSDGSVSREAVGKLVFGDRRDLDRLNGILHPRIRREIVRRISEARAAVPAIVLDAAVLLEAGWDDLCDVLVYVDAPEHLRAQRVRRERQWDEELWRQREKSQISLDKKAARCKYTIVNSSYVPRMSDQVRRVFHEILQAERA